MSTGYIRSSRSLGRRAASSAGKGAAAPFRAAAAVATVALVLAAPQPALAHAAEDFSSAAELAEQELLSPPVAGPRAESESGLWLVQLTDPPLAAYQGGIRGLAPTNPRMAGESSLDVAAPASTAYLDHLAARQAAAKSEIDNALGRSIDVVHTYRHAVNGLAVQASAAEAERLAQLPGVALVEPDHRLELETDLSNDVMGSAAIWDGETGSGIDSRGEGVIVGMLDTGVNPDHPSFAATDGDGYTHTNPFGAGNYVGVCDPEHSRHEDICNDKLIGAWDFAVGSLSARDDHGHGSHVGSTIAGNKHDAVFTVGSDEYTRTIQGVAPRANVISYRVCAPGCFSSASVAAVDQAIADGVDVLNFSISGPDNPWGNTVDQAFLAAFEAGIFVAASAGNTGPDEGTVSKTAPWNATVAATNHPRVIGHRLDVTAPEPTELTGLVAVPGDGPAVSETVEAELRYAGAADPGNDEGCDPFPAEAFDGVIALIQRGTCLFNEKVDNAAAAGAVAVVTFNQYAGPPFTMGELQSTAIPAVMVGRDDGHALRDLLVDHPAAQVRIGTDTTLILDEDWPAVMTDFSSRGPSSFDLLGPTFTTPGRGILAAAAADADDPVQYRFMQGTSMASPHAAGAGALLAALHPDWSPAQIRSALAATADPTGIRKHDGVTPADPFDVGSGLVDLSQASRLGLVLDETHANFVAANPATGGDPRTLNLPAMVDQNCDDVCSWTRELTSVAAVPATYTVTVDAPAGMQIAVEPALFTVAPGTTQSLEVTADVSELIGGDWLFADLTLTTDATHGPGGPPIAPVHYPMALIPAEAEFTVDPAELSSLQDVAEQVTVALQIGNTGGAELEWEVTEADCPLPSWVDVAPRAGTLAPGGEQEVPVTFDSTGMSGGEYHAELCLTSNDPHRPTASVSLTLEVVEIPVVEVSPGSLAATQPGGTVTAQTLTIGNAGHGVLEWSLAEEDAGPSEERVQLLRDGVLLVPNSASANRGVMAFDPHTGDLIDPEFIPHVAFDPDSTLYTPKHILPKPDGSGFLMTDQVRWMITEYDLEGNFVGIFAPTSGERQPEILANLRGMAWSPQGTLLVTVAAQDNAHSIVELDTDGNYLGTYVAPGQGGLASPWYILFRDDDMLVSASTSSAIHRFSRDGTETLEPFAELNWPGQLVELDNGNILTVNWSGAGGAGVREFDADGNLLGEYVAAGSSYTGVHPLGNGNILTTTSTGVYEIDRDGEVLNTKFAGSRARYVTHVQLPDALPCVTADEVAWLSVSQDHGTTVAGETSAVTVRFDSAGLSPGTHTVQLCVTSDDPDTPLVPVPVSLTVADATCDRTIDGTHTGPLAVTTGLTCLAHGAGVTGPVTVRAGAGLYSDGAAVSGPVSATRADTVALRDTTVIGPVTVRQAAGGVVLDGNEIVGPVRLNDNVAGGDQPTVVSGNRITGPLSCAGNEPAPVNDGEPNQVSGRQSGQCASL